MSWWQILYLRQYMLVYFIPWYSILFFNYFRSTKAFASFNYISDRILRHITNALIIYIRRYKALLSLIARPAYGPSDYDAKERELKSSKVLSRIYREKILPVWFPQLRCTKFVINTRLRPMPDEKLALKSVIETVCLVNGRLSDCEELNRTFADFF